MKLKVVICPCSWGYCANIKANPETMKALVKGIREMFKALMPAICVGLNFNLSGYGIDWGDDVATDDGTVGWVDSEELRAKDLNDFIEKLRNILDKAKAEYEFEVVK